MADSSFYWDNLLSPTFEMATFLKWYWDVQKILEEDLFIVEDFTKFLNEYDRHFRLVFKKHHPHHHQ